MSPKDSQWLSPLHHAAASGHAETVKELLRNHADPMARDKNWMTPLHMAALNNHIQCAGEGVGERGGGEWGMDPTAYGGVE